MTPPAQKLRRRAGVCTENLVLIEGESESPTFESDARADLDYTVGLGSTVQVEEPA